MNTVLEQALQLSKEEKLELYYALREELSEETVDEELSKEEWNEVERRYKDIENDNSQFISGDEFIKKLKILSNELRSKRS